KPSFPRARLRRRRSVSLRGTDRNIGYLPPDVLHGSFSGCLTSAISRARERDPMKIGVPRETTPGERRVALTPDAAAALAKGGLEVLVEAGAGEGAFHFDAAFERAGARVVADAGALYSQADVVLKVQKPTLDEVDRLREGTVLLAFLQALTSPELV